MPTQASPYTVSADPALLDLQRIHRWLSEESYWAEGRLLATVRASIEHSLAFGAYCDGAQVGLARVVTDRATFGWLCDVFVDQAHRGRGVGKLLVEAVVAHPVVRSLPLMVLATRDAHGLYEGHGDFHGIEKPYSWMVRRRSPPSADTLRATNG